MLVDTQNKYMYIMTITKCGGEAEVLRIGMQFSHTCFLKQLQINCHHCILFKSHIITKDYL